MMRLLSEYPMMVVVVVVVVNVNPCAVWTLASEENTEWNAFPRFVSFRSTQFQ